MSEVKEPRVSNADLLLYSLDSWFDYSLVVTFLSRLLSLQFCSPKSLWGPCLWERSSNTEWRIDCLSNEVPSPDLTIEFRELFSYSFSYSCLGKKILRSHHSFEESITHRVSSFPSFSSRNTSKADKSLMRHHKKPHHPLSGRTFRDKNSVFAFDL